MEKIYDPKQNIEGGVRYLKYLMQLYHGDERLALAPGRYQLRIGVREAGTELQADLGSAVVISHVAPTDLVVGDVVSMRMQLLRPERTQS